MQMLRAGPCTIAVAAFAGGTPTDDSRTDDSATDGAPTDHTPTDHSSPVACRAWHEIDAPV